MLVFFFVCMILAFKNILCDPASWAGAFGSLAAALVALWGTMNNDIQNKERRYSELSREIWRLKKLQMNLEGAQYSSQLHSKEPGAKHSTTWYQNWRDNLSQLRELKEILKGNHMPTQKVDDFITYIENGNTQQIKSRLEQPLLSLQLIYELKESQLKDME